MSLFRKEALEAQQVSALQAQHDAFQENLGRNARAQKRVCGADDGAARGAVHAAA